MCYPSLEFITMFFCGGKKKLLKLLELESVLSVLLFYIQSLNIDLYSQFIGFLQRVDVEEY